MEIKIKQNPNGSVTCSFPLGMLKECTQLMAAAMMIIAQHESNAGRLIIPTPEFGKAQPAN